MSINIPSLAHFTTRIDIKEAQVLDLRDRLRNTRWPIAPEGKAWENGTSLAYLRDVVDYWLDSFDWRIQEERLNCHEHIVAPINGRNVHAVVMRSEKGERPPIVLAHGWPGSFVEFLEIGERLSHPERFGHDAKAGSTVIIVSLPGCGLSSPPKVPIGPREIAGDWLQLMTDTLKIEKFVVHGGDWGAAIASWLAVDAPEVLYGLHLTSAIIQPEISTVIDISDEEQVFLAQRENRSPSEGAYRVLQGSKPLTLSYSLSDSPVGLAAWLLEKYQAWGVSTGTQDPPSIPLQELVTIISLYWFADPGPSTWIYRFLIDGTGLKFPAGVRVNVPTAVCSFQHDVSPVSPASWQRRCYDVVQHSRIDHGGHFPGLDAPQALAKDLREFVASVCKNQD